MEREVQKYGGRVGSPRQQRLLTKTCSPDQIRYVHHYPGGSTMAQDVPAGSVPVLPYQVGAYYNPYMNVQYTTMTPTLLESERDMFVQKNDELMAL